jgi:hypothetical protein
MNSNTLSESKVVAGQIGEVMNKASRAALVLGILGLLAGTISFAQVQTYCTNIAGNIACTSYDQGAASQSYCTSIAGNLSCTTYDDDYSRIQIRQDYEAGQVIGTALGDIIAAAIADYRAHKRLQQTKQDAWNQFVQDTLSANELECEADPGKQNTTVLGCRTMIFTFNQFLQRHKKDFVPDGKNVEMMANALDKAAPADQSTWTELTYEQAFQTVDKKQLDKKIYLGLAGKSREAW